MSSVKGKRPVKKTARKDSWTNQLNGLGDVTRDKRLSATLNPVARLTDVELETMVRSNDLAAGIVRTWPEEMWREGFDLQVNEDHELAEAITTRLEDLKVAERFKQAEIWARQYGGAAVYIGTKDQDVSKPIQPGTEITHLTAFPPVECVPVEWYANPLSKSYGNPKFYQIMPQVSSGSDTVSFDRLKVHASRMIHFGGVVTSRMQSLQQRGYGDSVLQVCHEVLRDFDITWDAAAILMQDFSQAVVKVTGLAENMLAENDNYLKNRMTAIDMSRSVARAVILDEGEEFSRVPTPMSGMPETLDRFFNRIAAAARTPVTIMFGQAPAGLNATGESDIRHFYARVRAAQTNDVTPKLEALIRLLFAEKTYSSKQALDAESVFESAPDSAEPDSWKVVWRPLWAPTDLEGAQARFVQAQTDALEITNDIVTPEEVARSRHGVGGYSFETTIDLDMRDQMEADRVAQEEAMADAEVEKAKNPDPPPFGGPPGKGPPKGKNPFAKGSK